MVIYLAKCGKVLAGWTPNSQGNYNGGYAPNPEHIVHKKDDFNAFCQGLLREEIYLKKEVKLFLGCVITRFFKPFKQHLSNCPDNKYLILGTHPLMMEIFGSLDSINCSEDDLDIWCDEINSGFVRDNFQYLSLKYMDEIDPSGDHKKTLIDQRSVVDVVKDLALAADTAAKESRKLDSECKELLCEQKKLVEQISDLNKGHKMLTNNLKLCVEHQMTTNKKVDMMERYLIGMMGDMRELKEIVVDVSKNVGNGKKNELHTASLSTQQNEKISRNCDIGKLI